VKIRHTAVPSRRRSRSERALTAALVVSTFAVYLRTSARALTGEDAGELVTAAYELGIPHPPGYPLWCLLAKAFTWIPIGSVAFRVSLLSAVFGSLASLLLFAYFRTFQVRPLLAAAAAGLFAFSRTFWSQAVIPEVYTLNVFFLLGVLWMLRRWTVKGRRRDLFGAALFFGFGAAHHPIVLTLAPVFLLYVLIGVLRGRDPALEVRRLPLVLLLAALPFAVYAYLPLRARAEPFVNWSRPETLDGALSHLRREVYDRAPDVPPPPRTVERTARQAGIFAGRYVREFLPPTLLLVPFGIFLALRRSRRDGALLLLIAGACSLGVIWLTNFDLVYEHIHANSIFWIPTYLVSAVWIGITLEGLASGGLRLPDSLPFDSPPGSLPRSQASSSWGRSRCTSAGTTAAPASGPRTTPETSLRRSPRTPSTSPRAITTPSPRSTSSGCSASVPTCCSPTSMATSRSTSSRG